MQQVLSKNTIRSFTHIQGQHVGWQGGKFYKNCNKIVKSAIFEVEKPLEIDPDLGKFKKKKKKKIKPAVF